MATAQPTQPRLTSRFGSNQSGATAVEFGLVAFPFLLTVLFLMSIGYMVYVKQGLDFATQKAARQIRIGTVQLAQLTQSQFVAQQICPYMPMTVNCANVIVNVNNVPYTPGSASNYLSYTNYVNSQQTNVIIPALTNTGATYCPGQGGKTPSYVYLQVLYPVPAFLGLFASSATAVYNGQKVFLVMATATFLNEPFVAPASAC